MLVVLSTPATASDTPPPTDLEGNEIDTVEEAVEAVLDSFDNDDELEEHEEVAQPATGIDECDWEIEDRELQDQSQEVVRSWSCHTFRWFDAWWGDSYDFPEHDVAGTVLIGAEYNQYEGFDPRMRFRVRAPLPNFSRRWDVMIGRGDEDAFISDTQTKDPVLMNPALSSRDQEDAWLLGLGHRRKKRRTGWDWSVGLRLRLPPVPYVKTAYNYNRDISEITNLRLRQTFYWRSDDGFGTTTRGFLTHGLSTRNVIRWEGILTFSEEADGAKWYLGHSWFHLMQGQHSFSLLTFARGESEAEVPLKEYGFKFVWRRPWTRDWMYLSMGPTITWPRELEEETRELSLGFGLWIEMQFGNWRYR